MSDTVEDLSRRLEAARDALRLAENRAANDGSNNPNPQGGTIANLRAEVFRLEQQAKDMGAIPLTDQERLARELDAAFPDAQSNQVVEYKGVKYQKKFSPVAKSRSGKTVKAWDSWWQPTVSS